MVGKNDFNLILVILCFPSTEIKTKQIMSIFMRLPTTEANQWRYHQMINRYHLRTIRNNLSNDLPKCLEGSVKGNGCC